MESLLKQYLCSHNFLKDNGRLGLMTGTAINFRPNKLTQLQNEIT
jgi:hypothetical protein